MAVGVQEALQDTTIYYNLVGKNHTLQYSYKCSAVQRYLKMDWMLLCIFILPFKILPSLSTNVTQHLQHCGVVDLIAKNLCVTELHFWKRTAISKQNLWTGESNRNNSFVFPSRQLIDSRFLCTISWLQVQCQGPPSLVELPYIYFNQYFFTEAITI